MGLKFKLTFLVLVGIEIILVFLLVSQSANFQLLNSQGPIARQQRDLMFAIVGIMLVLAIPLLSVFYYFTYKYRAVNKSLRRDPDLSHGKIIELLWWIIPSLFVCALALITWNKTHALDPYKPLDSNIAPVRIQVVALQWKWLFLYPDYNIATINFIQFPQKTPINFELTADAPMNSFWIPSLSGQIYAMTGMSTKLHIMANGAGDYRGQAAEINGRGFSGMNFVARSGSQDDFEGWIAQVRSSSRSLDWNEYEVLSLPSEKDPVTHYSSYDPELYNKIIMKFMSPGIKKEPTHNSGH